MTTWRFILVSAGIFLAEYFTSIFWPFLLRADLFAVWVLAVFFLDRANKINLAAVFGTIIFFDFWSGSSFGGLTVVLLLTLLVIFLVKKVMLTDSRINFSSFLWLVDFYCLSVFLKAILYDWGWPFIVPNFSLIELVWAVSSILVVLLIYRIVSYGVSRF